MGTSQVPTVCWALRMRQETRRCLPSGGSWSAGRPEVRDELVWACVMPRGRGLTGGKRRGGLQAGSIEVRSFEAGVSNAKREQSLCAKPL